jgi:hypothetical protein
MLGIIIKIVGKFDEGVDQPWVSLGQDMEPNLPQKENLPIIYLAYDENKRHYNVYVPKQTDPML